jgi:hypothetical protein
MSFGSDCRTKRKLFRLEDIEYSALKILGKYTYHIVLPLTSSHQSSRDDTKENFSSLDMVLIIEIINDA